MTAVRASCVRRVLEGISGVYQPPHIRQSAWSFAEDRGFEPRRVVTPNRISSPFGFPEVASRRVNLTDVAQVSALRGARRSNRCQPAATCVVPFLCHPMGLPRR